MVTFSYPVVTFLINFPSNGDVAVHLLGPLQASSVSKVHLYQLGLKAPVFIQAYLSYSIACPPAGEYLLNVLVANKQTYKGLIIPGGKVGL